MAADQTRAQLAEEAKRASLVYCRALLECADRATEKNVQAVERAADSLHAAIFVGDVSSKKLVKTKMAKSTHDAGWAMFKTMLEQKCHRAGIVFKVVNEAWSTQTCNVCGVIAGPKGRAGLNKRSWVCSCGVEHDRDVNAALVIRRIGLDSLAEGAVL